MSQEIKDFANSVLHAVRHKMFGVDEVIRLSLVALYTEGHILLEGNPGLGKTELVKTLGEVLQLPFGRIQFTPDLMPADITGTFMPGLDSDQPLKLAFQPGPIFTALLLADEINRATPKTQAAMLEGMAERQVTVLGKKWPLERPFMVLATQNPIDHEGTYNLPEAQADRFMFKVLMPLPDRQVLHLIMSKQTGVLPDLATESPMPMRESLVDIERLLPNSGAESRQTHTTLRERIEAVMPTPLLATHITNIFLASNRRFNELMDLEDQQRDQVQRLVEGLVTYGLGPRAAIALMLGAKAWSLLFLPDAEHAEAPALAHVLIPTLRHRLKLDFDWVDRYRSINDQEDQSEEQLLAAMLADLAVATAPTKYEYRRVFRHSLDQVMRDGIV